MIFEIKWDDLKDEKKIELIADGFKIDENFDLDPIAVIVQEEDV